MQENPTLIAAITLRGGMGKSITVEGATDAEVLEACVEHFLMRIHFVRGR